jgi:hypothetical protein
MGVMGGGEGQTQPQHFLIFHDVLHALLEACVYL